MQKEQLIHLVENPASLQKSNIDELQNALLAYPFCQTLLMLYAKTLHRFKPQKFDTKLKKIALSVNREKLFFLINEELSEKSKPLSKTDLLLNTFETKNFKIEMSPDYFEKEPETLQEEEFFSETLAKIYIKQKKYEKAIKIFDKLSLQYPEKSIYFAPQINFLKIIIDNQQKNN